MISLDSDTKTIVFTKPIKLSELETHLKTFRRVYKDLSDWTVTPLAHTPNLTTGEDTKEIPFIKPEMPTLDPTGSEFDLNN